MQFRSHALVVCGALFFTACASPGGSPASQLSAGTTAGTPKTIRIAFQGFEEPNQAGLISYGSAGGFDPLEHFMIFHASLTVFDEQGNRSPRLAAKVPSVQDGDWKVLPDGQMEVTWKLRPNAQWHDGSPLVSEDFALGLQVVNDPEIPVSKPGWTKLVAGVDTPDAQTLVVHWKEPWFEAGGGGAKDIPALPTHLLTDLYKASDKQAFINSPYWTSEFVGLGPYKLSQWQLGSFIEGVAFDRYVLGKPKIDRIRLIYVGDVNAIVAGILSSDLDIVPMGTRFHAEELEAVRNGWGDASGRILLGPAGARTVYFQMRDPSTAWARDPRVRRALVHAIDREGINEAVQFGWGSPADTLLTREDSRFAPLEKTGLARYPFDQNRARQLLAEAGWTPGADGLWRDQQGEILSLDLSGTAQGSNVQEVQAVASNWQQVGIKVSPVPISPQAANLDELKNSVKGGFMWPLSADRAVPEQLTSAQVASDQTRWKGSNYAGYKNPAYDDLYNRSVRSLETENQQQALIDALRLLSEEVPVIPVYHYGNGIIIRKGLDGPGLPSPGQTSNAWNIHTWSLS
ncbi:MAG TPA: peptide ABC transporter substrate-binding protein [Chloroflexota bacterium]